MSDEIKFPLKFENFECEPYETNDHMVHLTRFESLDVKNKEINKFSTEGLQDKINKEVAVLDRACLLKTYLVYGINKDKETNSEKKELACVFSLRSNTMHFENKKREEFFKEIVPCVELVYLAVDKKYREKYPISKSIGSVVFDAFITPIVKEINELCGCKYLFLFAIDNPDLINYYIEKMDFQALPKRDEKFVVNKLTTDDNVDCKFLYQLIENM